MLKMHAGAEILSIAHTAFLIGVSATPFVGNKLALEAYQAIPPALLIHWATNNGQCCLVQLEDRMRGRKDGPNMIQRLSKRVGLKISKKQSTRVSVIGLLAAWMISIIRLFHFKE